MSVSYLLASTDPDTSVLLAQKLTDFLKNTAESFIGVVQTAALAVIFFFILKELVSSFTLTKLLVAGLVGGIAIWLIGIPGTGQVGGGVRDIGKMIGEQTSGMAPTPQQLPVAPVSPQV